MATWTERQTDRPDLPEGDIGGDVQRSDAWGRRFARHNDDGTWDVLTVSYYTAADDGESSTATHIVEQVETITCTDPDDPGSTELRYEYDYATVARVVDGYPITEDECRRLRDAFTLDYLTGEYPVD